MSTSRNTVIRFLVKFYKSAYATSVYLAERESLCQWWLVSEDCNVQISTVFYTMMCQPINTGIPLLDLQTDQSSA